MTAGTTNISSIPFEKDQDSSALLLRFMKSVSMMNKRTANEYYSRLLNFERFVLSQYDLNLDELIDELKKGDNSKKFDVYDVLGNYGAYLIQESNNTIHTTTLKQRIVTAKNFLEYYDVDISPRKFKIKVRLPKDVKRDKEAIDKTDIVNILKGCSDIKLRTYVMLLASTGMRAVEALSIRLTDLDLESIPAKLTIRGEFTKTKTDRYVFLTGEMVDQFTKWIDYKYRKRRVCSKDRITGKWIDEYRKPEKQVDHLIFSLKNDYEYINKPVRKWLPRSKPHNNYYPMADLFGKTLDRIGMGSREESNERRRKITLHSFRRFVKSTISDLGYVDYSEWFIGHSGSTYWRKKDKEKAEIFKKIEPYLTFLDIQQLERQGADLQTKIEELQDINQVLRNRESERENQIKKLEDSIAFLSDRFNAFLKSQPENKIIYDEDHKNKGVVKGLELKPEINNLATAEVIPSSSSSTATKKKK